MICHRLDIFTSAAILIAAVFGLIPFVAQAQIGIPLGINEQKTIDLGVLADSVDLSTSGVVEIQRGTNKAQLSLRGKSLGTTDVSVRLADGKTVVYHVSVTDSAALNRRVDQMRKLLGSVPGLTISVHGAQIVLAGKITNRSTLQTINSVKAQYPGFVIDGTDKNLPAVSTVVQTINRVLSDNDITSIQAAAYGRILVLEGSAKDEGEKELALRIARMISSEVEDRISRKSSAAPSINIEVMFVEVDHKNNRQVGFSNAIGGKDTGKENVPKFGAADVGGIGGKAGRLAWQISSLSSFLTLLQTRSASRVLSNPQIIGRSGEEAHFHSGGTSYFSVAAVDENGRERSQTQEINHGIELRVLPVVDRLGQIDTKLDTKVSAIESTNVKDKIAELGLTSLKTAVTLKNGQSILLSGLVLKRNTKKIDKVPLLGDIPIVGEIFKSRTQDDEEKELLILVTMNRIVGSDQATDQATRLWEGARNDIEFSIFD